ncbi:hypothetical protein [Rhodopila globiformis]|uniref:DUF4258 domain-containing protein n=1 Tax=Rhodopila globiformis TaxID=1071 RepID=A0A2S6NHQ4_RHOGL|nr:hypothetical protein [Rhodopila globiformis]PPQ34156.1 hypothetical protein CCS01_12305 [Rhodopila globiformis]
MNANDNLFETSGAEVRFTLTNHAKDRMTTRALRADAINAALAYGRVVCVRGADIYVIGRKEIARYAKERIDLSAYDGVQVVTADGVILTLYRNSCFNRLRDRRTHRCPLAFAA